MNDESRSLNVTAAETPAPMGIEKCTSCGVPLLWRHNDKTQKLAPLNYDPDPAGNCWLVGEIHYHVRAKRDGQPEPIPTDPATGAPVPLYMPHFATCPASKFWKGKSRR